MGSPWISETEGRRRGPPREASHRSRRTACHDTTGVAAKMSTAPDATLVARLARHGQGHLLRWWGDLDEAERARLVADVEGIDFDQLDALVERLVRHEAAIVPEPERVGPVAVHR